MAKPNWLVVNPSTGSGNGTISNSSSEHTGRVARTGTVTVTGVGKLHSLQRQNLPLLIMALKCRLQKLRVK